MERDARLLSYIEFYSIYIAGRTIEIDARNVPQLIGVNPRHLHFLAYVPNRGWIEVPVEVFDKCLNIGEDMKYCLVPQRIDRDTRVLVKAPPSISMSLSIALRYIASLQRIVGKIERAFTLSLKIVAAGKIYTVSYLVVVSRYVNKWVLEGEVKVNNVENDFTAWGLQNTYHRLRQLLGFALGTSLAEILRVYSVYPMKPSFIEVKPLSVGEVRKAQSGDSSSTYVLEFVPLLRSWSANGSASPSPLVIDAMYQFLPEGKLSKYIIGYPVTQSVTLSITVKRLEGSGEASLTVELVCSNNVVYSKSYVVYMDYARIKPTFYWPPCNTAEFKVLLRGGGKWSVSIAGMVVVHLVESNALKNSKLRKELRLYVLGSPSSNGPSSFITLPLGSTRGDYIALLLVPFNLALIPSKFYDGSSSKLLTIRVSNLGSTGAYITLCFAGACSNKVFVGARSSTDIAIDIWASSIGSYFWYLQPVPLFIEVEKASNDGTAVLELQPENSLTLLARPVRPFYPGMLGSNPYIVTTLLSDNCVAAWQSGVQEFRGGIDFTAMGYSGSRGGFASVFAWFGTSVENTVGGSQPRIDIAILFSGNLVEKYVPYEILELVTTLSGEWVGKGIPEALSYNKGSNLPKLPEVPPPLAIGTGLIASATLPALDSIVGMYDLAAWLWNQLLKYAKNEVEIHKSDESVTYRWVHGPYAPPVETMFFEVVDEETPIPSYVHTLNVTIRVHGAEEYGPYQSLDAYLKSNLRLATLP
ncbi:MAG: hypothetical protein GXO32_00255 [Crenarchaeota archaeon]|nr:hypothetical protein [Thermoproteota archaeon]